MAEIILSPEEALEKAIAELTGAAVADYEATADETTEETTTEEDALATADEEAEATADEEAEATADEKVEAVVEIDDGYCGNTTFVDLDDFINNNIEYDEYLYVISKNYIVAPKGATIYHCCYGSNDLPEEILAKTKCFLPAEAEAQAEAEAEAETEAETEAEAEVEALDAKNQDFLKNKSWEKTKKILSNEYKKYITIHGNTKGFGKYIKKILPSVQYGNTMNGVCNVFFIRFYDLKENLIEEYYLK